MTGRRARKGARCGKETLGGDGGQKTRSLKCRSQIEKRGRTCHEQMWTFKGMAFFLPTMILQEETLLIRTEDPTHKNPFVLTPVDEEAERGREGNLNTTQQLLNRRS